MPVAVAVEPTPYIEILIPTEVTIRVPDGADRQTIVDVLAACDPFVDSIQALEDRNANADAAVSIMAPRTKADLAKLVDTTGQSLRKPQSIESLPMRATTQVPVDETYMTRSDATRIITGDFFVGIRSELRVEVLKERFADNLQYGFLAWLRTITPRRAIRVVAIASVTVMATGRPSGIAETTNAITRT